MTVPTVEPPPSPQDADAVISAFRFGWAIAELRGRYRPGVDHTAELIGTPEVKRSDNALPLATERSPAEQRIEVARVVNGLGARLGLTFAEEDKVTTDSFDSAMTTLEKRATDDPAWQSLTYAFYLWDRQIQDTLVLSPLLSAGYQLGRGLAETYWELDPRVTEPLDARAWQIVLGPERIRALTRLVSRLSAFVDPLTIPAVTASLETWGRLAVAENGDQRDEPDTRQRLFLQGLLWRDLIRGERRPGDLVVRTGFTAQTRVIKPFLSQFWPQIVSGLVAVALLVVGATGLSVTAGDKWVNTAISILGALGITSAGLYARAKSAATSTFDSLRTQFEAERVGAAATLCPDPPPHKPLVRRVGHGTEPVSGQAGAPA